MSFTTFGVALTEYTIYTGPYQTDNIVATFVVQLGNTAHQAIVSFYDLPYNEIPGNNRYSSDFGVSLPSDALGGFISMITGDLSKVAFLFDYNTYHAQFVYKS